MGCIKRFFFDTYALIEVYYGNKNYAGYLDCGIVTTRLNLMEAYYHLLKDHGERIANEYYDGMLHYAIEQSDVDVKNGMKFRLAMKSRGKNLSYVDAIGFIISRRLGIKFLTGDMAFEGMKGVEYVK